MAMSAAFRQKLAIMGSTYARALTNAAQRTGKPFAPEAFDSIAKQPLARPDPHASAFARGRQAPGELPMTPQRQEFQNFTQSMPWATDEHTGLTGGSNHAVTRYNQMLEDSGRAHTTPAGQPTTHQQITQNFGRPNDPQRAPTKIDGSPMKPAPARQQMPGGPKGMSAPPGRGLFDLMDDRGQPTQWGPAPVAQRPRPMPSRPVGYAPPARPIESQLHAVTPSAIPGHSTSSTAGTAVLKSAGVLPTAAGVGIPLALGAGMLATKPGIQSNIKNLFAGKGSTEEQDKNNALPDAAMGQADAIHHALLSHGLDPRTMRIGIDAPPGSGKTTLARALAQRTGMTHYGLDWEPGNAWKSTIGLGRNVEKMPHAPRAGEIMEHYLLNRTHDPELFDAQIHLKRDPNLIRQQLTQRGNAAYIGDTMDLDKSLGVADLGFDTLGGDTIDLGNGTLMKLRPREGWGSGLDQQLQQRGIDAHDLSRHEKLLSLYGGHRTTGAGWTPYVKNPFSTGQTLALGASIPLGVMAAKALAKHGSEEKDAGVMDALRRAGSGIRNQVDNLNMHVGHAMGGADPHAMLNPTMPVPGIGAATNGVVNFLGSKIPGRAGGWAAKGIDAALPSTNPQGFGARKLIGHAVNALAPNIGPMGTAVTEGLVHGVPAALRRVLPSAAPHVGTLLKESL